MAKEGFGGFVVGAAIGAAVGAVAGVLLAPKSGKETREDIKRFADDFAEQAMDMYQDARDSLDRKVTAFKRLGKKLSREKYMELINEVIEDLKAQKSVDQPTTKRIESRLRKDWEAFNNALSA